jgi:hypothetical protein
MGLCSSQAVALVAVPLPTVVVFEVEVHLFEFPLDLGDEGGATGGQGAEALDRVAFGVIVRHD